MPWYRIHDDSYIAFDENKPHIAMIDGWWVASDGWRYIRSNSLPFMMENWLWDF